MSLVSRLHDSVEYLCAGAVYFLSRSRRKMRANLTPLDDIVQLSPTVCRVLGQNPGPFTLQGTNTYLIGSGSKKVLIDASEPNVPNYIDKLAKALDGAELSCIIATHYHNDHVGGIPDVLRLIGSNPSNTPIYKLKRADGKADDNSQLFQYVDDGHEIFVDGASLKLIHTPGHTCDHSVVYMKEENSVFSGDCILGEGTTVFDDLHAYMNSLEILRKIDPLRIYPGHGPVVDSPNEKIAEYISHRLKREEQVIKALESVGNDGATAATVTRIVYPDLPLSVRIGAIGNVKHHLTKLMKEGRAVEERPEIYKLARAQAKV